MKPADLLDLLIGVYRDKLALVARHEAHAREVGDYDFNNTYQYILAREEAQLTWIRAAIEELGGHAPDRPSAAPEISPRRGAVEDRSAEVLRQDASEAQAFVDRWRPRLEPMTHIRNKGMLGVVLGEALEHKRFFEQALAGRKDLLGRRADGAGTAGTVLPTRWLE